MRIIAFGDSITYGAWDIEGGWVDRIKRRAHAKVVNSNGSDKKQVLNLGIGGDTTTKLLSRIEVEIKNRFSANWPLVIIIAIGTNDGRKKSGVAEVSIGQFEENISKIITIVQKYTDKVAFLGLPPVGSKDLEFKDFTYSNTTLKQYDATLGRIAKSRNVDFLPIMSVFELEQKNGLLSTDLLHPSNKGHQLIEEIVLSYLEKVGVSGLI